MSDTIERPGFDRREALKKAAVAGGIAWATPMIISSVAHAQAPPCTPKCAPNGSQFTFTATGMKLPCQPGIPPGQQAVRVQVTVTATARSTCPCTGAQPAFTQTVVFV